MRAIRLLIPAALLFFAVPAAAQGEATGQGQQGQPRQARQNEMLFKDITLTDAQKAQVDSIQAAYRTMMRDQMGTGGMQDSATRAKMAELRSKQMADIRKVLTPDQQVIFDKNLAAIPPMGGGRRPPR